MTVNRTTLLDLPLPVTGTESGTWGDTTNNGLSQYMDIAIAGMNSLTSANFTAGALTLANTLGDSSATNIAAGSAQYATIKVSSLAVNSTITAPGSNRSYRIINADATYSLTIKASGQTGVTFLPGQTGVVAFNGTDYVIVGVVGAGTATDNAVARFDGTTGEIIQNSGVTIDDSNNVSGIAQLNITTLDATNIEVTNIKAKDGTAAASIADSTGVISITSNPVLSGGTANGVLYLNGSKVATSGSALVFDGTNLGIGTSSPAMKLDVRVSNSASLQGALNLSNSVNSDFSIQLSSSVAQIGTGTSTPIVFATGNAERMRLDASGNLGLGVTPSAWASGYTAFQIKNSALMANGNDVWFYANGYFDGGANRYIGTGYASRYIQTNGQHQWATAPSGTAGNAITFSQVMTLDASGNLGVGLTSPTAKLVVYGGLDATYNANVIVASTASTAKIAFEPSGITSGIQGLNDGGIAFFCNGVNTERARITSGGDLLVGTTSATFDNSNQVVVRPGANSWIVQGGTCLTLNRTGTDGGIVEFYKTSSSLVGSISVTGSATAYNTSSDYRLKDNQQPLTGSGAFIDALKPKTWNWKANGSKGVGFIAHEVQEVSPSSVSGEKDGEQMQAMEYGSAEFIANIIAELQSLRQRVAELEGK